MILPDHLDGYAVALAFAFLAATWAGLLMARFIAAPARLYWEQWNRTEKFNVMRLAKADEEIYPNVRVADNSELVELFITPSVERNKLIGLLQEGGLRSWGRNMESNDTDLHKLDTLVWHQEKLTFRQVASLENINQTFVARYLNSARPWSALSKPSHYDVWLNFAQLKKVWPNLQIEFATKEVR